MIIVLHDCCLFLSTFQLSFEDTEIPIGVDFQRRKSLSTDTEVELEADPGVEPPTREEVGVNV